MKDIYRTQMENKPWTDMGEMGIDKAIADILDGKKAAIFTSKAALQLRPEYPCQLKDIPKSAVQFYVDIAMPMPKACTTL